VSQVNRATSETLRQQATQEGLVPLKAWVKSALDHVIQECMNEPGLEFVWVGDDAIDPLEQAQTLQILVGAGIKTHEEARADLWLGPTDGKEPAGPRVAISKHNPHHDERGRFATADNAAEAGSSSKSPPAREHDHVVGEVSKPGQSSALVDIGTLVGQQNIGDFTFCTYRSNVFGDHFQILSDDGTCDPTAPRPK
jgi:hypothetical protein